MVSAVWEMIDDRWDRMGQSRCLPDALEMEELALGEKVLDVDEQRRGRDQLDLVVRVFADEILEDERRLGRSCVGAWLWLFGFDAGDEAERRRGDVEEMGWDPHVGFKIVTSFSQWPFSAHKLSYEK